MLESTQDVWQTDCQPWQANALTNNTNLLNRFIENLNNYEQKYKSKISLSNRKLPKLNVKSQKKSKTAFQNYKPLLQKLSNHKLPQVIDKKCQDPTINHLNRQPTLQYFLKIFNSVDLNFKKYFSRNIQFPGNSEYVKRMHACNSVVRLPTTGRIYSKKQKENESHELKFHHPINQKRFTKRELHQQIFGQQKKQQWKGKYQRLA